MALCDRCGEEITLGNDLDRSTDIDRHRHWVMVDRKVSLTDHDALANLYAALPAAIWSPTMASALTTQYGAVFLSIGVGTTQIKQHASYPGD